MIRNLVCFDEGEKEHHFWVNKSTVCVNHRLSSVVMYFVATVRITGIQDERQPEPIMLTEGAEWDIFLDTVSLDYSYCFSVWHFTIYDPVRSAVLRHSCVCLHLILVQRGYLLPLHQKFVFDLSSRTVLIDTEHIFCHFKIFSTTEWVPPCL